MTTETKSVAELAAETKAAFEKSSNEVKAIAEEALGKAAANEKLSGDLKDRADNALTAANEAKARMDDLEQKLATFNMRDEETGMTAGEKVVNSDEFKSFNELATKRGRITIDVKDITSLTTDANGSVGSLVREHRVGMVELPQRRMTIRALLAPGTTSSSSVKYDKETGFTNNAEVVAEGALKPQSEIKFSDATADVVTIAHWMRASVQILDDAPGLRSMIDNRLRYGLAFKEEAELLNGSGTNGHLEGLVTAAKAFAAPGGLTAASSLDTLRLMMLQVALAEYPANGIVMNPIDVAAIEMMKDTQGRYLVGNPQGSMVKRFWGLPVVETQAMGVDKALVGAFDLAAQIFDRQNATVDVSTEDQDNFVRNKVTVRAEERLALAIYRPEAIVYGDLGRVA